MPTFSREKNVKVFTEMQHEFGLMILENIEINSSNLYYIQFRMLLLTLQS